MTNSLINGILVFAVAFCATDVFAKSAPYMIPAGRFMEEKVIIMASNVHYTQDELGNVVSLSYRMPAELDGRKARTIELTHREDSPNGLLSGYDATADCFLQDEDLQCEVNYKRATIDPNDPNSKIFSINVEAADKYIATQNLSAARISQLKSAQMSIMHEAIGILTLP